jgi:hypothetical protein
MRRGKKKIKKKTGRPARGGGHRMTLDPSEHFKKKKLKKKIKNKKHFEIERTRNRTKKKRTLKYQTGKQTKH